MSRSGRTRVIEPFTTIRGATRIGRGCTIRHSYLVDCVLEDGVSVGPFAYLRPGTVLRTGAGWGRSSRSRTPTSAPTRRVPHLSYIGDADVGVGTNLGAATITANYDGHAKHRTTVGSGVRTGVDTTLVAPVSVGDDAYTGAGSVITDDVPAGRARHRAGAAAQRRGLRRATRAEQGTIAMNDPRTGSTLPEEMSAIDTRTQSSRASLPIDYNKRLMLFSGRANPQLAIDIADKLGVDLGPVDAEDVLQRRGLLPLRGVDPRRRRVHRAVHLQQPRNRGHGERLADGAAVHDRRRRRRLGAPRDRGDAVVRLLAPGQEVRARASRSRRGWSRACSRLPAPTGC